MKIKSVGIVLRPKTFVLKDSFFLIKKFFLRHKIKIYIDKDSSTLVDEDGVDFNYMCENSDILISVGGDGTLISLLRKSCTYSKPVVGVNAGTFGFLANVSLDNINDFLFDLINLNYRVDERIILEACISNFKSNIYAFNDLIITSTLSSKMIILDSYINNELINIYKADGLIIASPTGSTAYNLSSNGPIIYPLLDSFVLTPICPHSLTQRPIVLPSNFIVKFKLQKGKGFLIVDGQDKYEFSDKDEVIIKVSNISAKLIVAKDINYFNIMQKKFNWGDK